MDEVDDLQQTWNFIGDQIGMDGEAVKQAVEPVKDLYTILDHTRSVLMAIEDVRTNTHTAASAALHDRLSASHLRKTVLKTNLTVHQTNSWRPKLSSSTESDL